MVLYKYVMLRVLQTEAFRRWLDNLQDTRAVVSVTRRLERVQRGNLGDVRSVGSGVSEMRISYGPGYRLYFVRRGADIVVLLCGGDKGSQDRDVQRAKRLAKEVEG